jgi:hypothetical protein
MIIHYEQTLAEKVVQVQLALYSVLAGYVSEFARASHRIVMANREIAMGRAYMVSKYLYDHCKTFLLPYILHCLILVFHAVVVQAARLAKLVVQPVRDLFCRQLARSIYFFTIRSQRQWQSFLDFNPLKLYEQTAGTISRQVDEISGILGEAKRRRIRGQTN